MMASVAGSSTISAAEGEI
ncbi:hypothetical protein V6N13_014279 [Hibiscus sabdariffa]